LIVSTFSKYGNNSLAQMKGRGRRRRGLMDNPSLQIEKKPAGYIAYAPGSDESILIEEQMFDSLRSKRRIWLPR
jgi:hypothetical protein